MPTYDYLCEECDSIVEIFHSISNNDDRYCEKCNSKLQRLMGAGQAAFVKGSLTPVQISKSERHEQYKERRTKMKKLGSEQSEIPWWRSKKDGTIRKDILKNPSKYIDTGET